jgi:hypothetical protein
MFIYHRNVSVSIVVSIIRKRNNDELTNNIYSFLLKYIHIHTDKQTDRQTHTHTFAFIYKKILLIVVLLLRVVLMEILQHCIANCPVLLELYSTHMNEASHYKGH